MQQYASVFLLGGVVAASFGYMGVHADVSNIARPIMWTFFALAVGAFIASFVI